MTDPKRWQTAAAALSGLAGFIHLAAAPSHFEEWLGYGAFFLVASTCQLLFALIVLAYTPPARELLWAGILGNAAIILLWLITRTAGIPFFGPAAGAVEAVGFLDALSIAVELTLIFSLARLFTPRAAPRA